MCYIVILSCSHLGDLAAAIDRDFGSFDNFKDQMSAKTVAIQGSGWGWLVSGNCCSVC